MTVVVLVCRVVLVGVFVVAAAAKLADLAGTRDAVIAFGGPKRLAGVVAAGLIAAELAVAGLLLPASTAAAGAAGALLLLSLFSAVVAVSLARGRAPQCHCFGQFHSAPASWRTLARNALLAVLAVVVLAGSLTGHDASAVTWIGRLNATGAVALGAAIAIIVVLAVAVAVCLSLLRSYGRLLVRLDHVERALAEHGLAVDDADEAPHVGLEPGTPAPAFAELERLLEPGLPLVLLFASAGCAPCRELMPEIAAWQLEYRDRLTVALAVSGSADAVHAEASDHELAHTIVDTGLDLYQRFGANGTPSALLIGADGTVASWVVSGADRIRSLVDYAADANVAPAIGVGSELPPLELPALDGEPVSLDALRGRETLLLFWNPRCGYCRAMHDDLASWERSVNGSGPRLVVLSSGDAESTREDGFGSLVLLDGDFAVAGLIGAGGTPAGVMVDAGGRVASRVAMGADAVLGLIGYARSSH